MADNMRPKLSVFILTFNERENITACLDSAFAVSDDVHLMDSFSTDETLAIAKARGAKVWQRKFDSFARQCNWALDNITFQNEWILRLDADERLTSELVKEVKTRLPQMKNDTVAVIFPKRMYFMGRWMRYGRMYPMLRLCLYRRDCGRYEDLEEEQFIVKSGNTIQFKNDFFEENQNNGLDYFTMKHLEYARDEAKEFLRGAPESQLKPNLFGNKIARTRWLKTRLYNRLPIGFRPLIYFLYRYLVCGGFLDGREGLIFHGLQGFWYRFYVDALIFESLHPQAKSPNHLTQE